MRIWTFEWILFNYLLCMIFSKWTNWFLICRFNNSFLIYAHASNEMNHLSSDGWLLMAKRQKKTNKYYSIYWEMYGNRWKRRRSDEPPTKTIKYNKYNPEMRDMNSQESELLFCSQTTTGKRDPIAGADRLKLICI